jgi:tRNA (guanine-N7-)-methyltransferase
VEVELGSAEAHFLIDRARQAPEGLYVGIEIREQMVKRARGQCRALGLDNVLNVFANMRVDLPKLFPQGRVRRMFLNFPDPWFKTRQHKRRVADPHLVDLLVPLLTADGEIHVNTDIFDIALDAMAALEGDGRLTNLVGPWRFARTSGFAARSRRERECESEGTKIWRLSYRLG